MSSWYKYNMHNFQSALPTHSQVTYVSDRVRNDKTMDITNCTHTHHQHCLLQCLYIYPLNGKMHNQRLYYVIIFVYRYRSYTRNTSRSITVTWLLAPINIINVMNLVMYVRAIMWRVCAARAPPAYRSVRTRYMYVLPAWSYDPTQATPLMIFMGEGVRAAFPDPSSTEVCTLFIISLELSLWPVCTFVTLKFHSRKQQQ